MALLLLDSGAPSANEQCMHFHACTERSLQFELDLASPSTTLFIFNIYALQIFTVKQWSLIIHCTLWHRNSFSSGWLKSNSTRRNKYVIIALLFFGYVLVYCIISHFNVCVNTLCVLNQTIYMHSAMGPTHIPNATRTSSITRGRQ